jgi:hypothetical protein
MVVRQIASIQRELSKTSFTQIGSLYEGPKCSGFQVGSFSPPVQFERKREHRGPWAKAREQMRELMEERLEEIVSNSEEICSERTCNGRTEILFDAGWFQKFYEAILHLVKHVELLDLWDGIYSISHPDLTTRNVLVDYEDPTHIIGLVDWEGARIQPWVG